MIGTRVCCFAAFCIGLLCHADCEAQVTILRKRNVVGKVASVAGNKLTIVTDEGNEVFQSEKPGDGFILLSRGGIRLRFNSTIKVIGRIPVEKLQPNQLVSFKALLSKPGKSKEAITELQLVNDPEAKLAITAAREPANSRDFVMCDVVARVESLRGKSLSLVLPKQAFTRSGGKLLVKLDEDAAIKVEDTSFDRVKAGDEVVSLVAADLSTEDSIIESVEIKLLKRNDEKKKQTPRSVVKTDSFAPSNYLKYSNLPSKPRDVRSAHFLIHTDVSDRSAKILLDKLERMVGLISGYYGKGLGGVIECYVVRDLSQWTDYSLNPTGVAKIKEPAGVTISKSLGRRRTAVVYSCDDHGVVQHEAVHAFCHLTFGSTGPTWYSEGMAEMGQYWKDKTLEVDINPAVIRYLTKAKPKRMLDIVATGQITGDSWQAYAWRWALCHLLANNPNYNSRFKALGVNMMSGGGASFESVYGDVANEISFEYDQFVKNFGNGYRVDLCAWDWNSKPRPLPVGRNHLATIQANRGWQSAKLKLNSGKKYEFVCKGEWQTSESGTPFNGSGRDDGNDAGTGKLVGVIFDDYKLTKIIELGHNGSFIAETDGHLYLRCKDEFTELSDNKGELKVYFRRSVK